LAKKDEGENVIPILFEKDVKMKDERTSCGKVRGKDKKAGGGENGGIEEVG
jgi:hypothetical protein